MSTLDEARARLDAVLAEGVGGHQQFERLREANREWETQMSLAHHCYGEPFKCISCGCSKDRPCVSHAGGRRHMAELEERKAVALEMIAARGLEPPV